MLIGSANAGNLPSVLEGGQPELQAAVRTWRAFTHVVETQQLVLQRVSSRLQVTPARRRHTDSSGVLLLNSLQPGKACGLVRTYCAEPLAPVMSQVRLPHVCNLGRTGEDDLRPATRAVVCALALHGIASSTMCWQA